MKFEGHSSASSEGVATDILEVVAFGGEANLGSCMFHSMVDVGAVYMVAGAVGVVGRDGKGGVVAGVGHDMVHPVG